MSESGQDDQSLDPPTTPGTAALANTIDKIQQLNFCTDLNLNTTSKLTLKRARTVDEYTLTDNKELTSSTQLLNYIFQMLMIVSFNAREFELKPSNSDNDKGNEDCFEESEDEKGGINPMDALLAIFYCSEDALRRYLVLKLSACQLSVPLLLPDHMTPSENVTILLSALRDIQKCWKIAPDRKSANHVFATEHPFPVVSFIRVGKLNKLSKSALINKIISDGSGNHEFFFHKNMKGGHVERKIVDGLVELAWYIPGKSRKTLQNEICFANLRGDARNFKKQRDLLLKNSSILCILFPSEKPDESMKNILEDAIQNKAKVILIFNEMPQTDAKEYFKDLRSKHSEKIFPITKAKFKNDDSFFKSMRENIQKNIHEVKAKPLVELASRVSEYDIQLDDDHSPSEFQKNVDSWLKEGIKEAKNLLKLQLHVPVLADLEREIASEISVDEKNERFEKEMDAQKESFKHLDKKILESLNSLTTMDETERNEALSKFKNQLDKMSLNIMAELNKENQKGNRATPLRSGDERLKQLQEKSQFSFGLEHIVRELAQLYQVQESKYDYAGVAADMLLSGQPLEILDGDSFYIPLEWFKAVFTKLEQQTNNAKVFVISVLGIQSSGKSTMLNTMFGLELPVSAGICTRGIFANLIPVSDSLKSASKFEYILVIDTKGLSGSEDPQLLKRDNELATFAIGVADLTIVNIFGESHNHVKRFLEIAVHALLKMKLVREEKSIKIVHQNVAAADAKEKLDVDRVKLKLALDEMTMRAAIQEDCEREIKELNDIISFDDNKDVFYIPTLHQGNPPMAPVNPDYGRNIQGVKESIMTLMCSNQTLRVSYFRKRVSSLWEAMQKENFIFSFRNEIEIRAHKALERKYFELSISKMVRGMNELQMKVESVLKKCSTREERAIKWTECQKRIENEAEEIRKEMEQETLDFFQSNEDRATLEQWSKIIQKKMENYKEIQVTELKDRCLSTYNHLQNLQDTTEKRLAFEAQLREKVGTFVATVDGGEDEKKRKKAFEEKWRNWIREIPECQEEQINVNDEMVKVLCNMEETLRDKMREKLDKEAYEISNFQNIDRIIVIDDLSYNIVKIDELIGSFFGNTHKKQCVFSAGIVKDSAVERAIEFAKSKLKSGVRCTPVDLKQMYHEIIVILEGKGKNYPYKFRDSLRCDILLHAFAKTCEIFEEMEERYVQERDIRGHIEKNLRPKMEKFSENAVKEKRNSFAATTFVEILQNKVESLVNQTVGLELIGILAKEKKFQNKGAFHASVLIELGEKSESAKKAKDSNYFEAYNDYLTDPVKFLKNKLKESIKTYCLANDMAIRKRRNEILKEIKENIINAISNASEETIKAKKNLTFWILRFVELCSKLCSTLVIGNETFSSAAIEDLESIGKFQEKVTREVEQDFKQWKTRDVNLEKYEPSPHDVLFKQMFSCQEKCPFCAAFCDKIISKDDEENVCDTLCDKKKQKHVHSTDFHRPLGVAGRKHEGTQKLSTAFCTKTVASGKTFRDASGKTHKYKDYKSSKDDQYSSWDITPDKTYKKSKYWQWFFATFTAELANFYGTDKPSKYDIPGTWKRRKFRDGKNEFLEEYNLHEEKTGTKFHVCL